MENGTRDRERRLRRRFPVECELKFRLLDARRHVEKDCGRTINISSKGVLFDAGCDLPVGKRVELSIAWPASLNGQCRLKMVTTGRIVRCENGRAAALIQRHDFRTVGGRFN